MRQGVFQGLEVGLLFEAVSLGPPFAKSQKMGDLGVLAEFAITRLCGQFRRRGLLQNVVQCLYFKRMLITS